LYRSGLGPKSKAKCCGAFAKRQIAWLWNAPTSGATRPPIGKALPANADQRAIGTHFVTVAKRNAMAVAEIELGKVR
jgi:hypothetical protein